MFSPGTDRKNEVSRFPKEALDGRQPNASAGGLGGIASALLCSPGDLADDTMRKQSTLPFGPRSSFADTFYKSSDNSAEVLALLDRLSEQQNSLLRMQQTFLSRLDEKEVGMRRWVEFMIAQKEGELWMQLEQHHTEMMTTLKAAANSMGKGKLSNVDKNRQMEILAKHHLVHGAAAGHPDHSSIQQKMHNIGVNLMGAAGGMQPAESVLSVGSLTEIMRKRNTMSAKKKKQSKMNKNDLRELDLPKTWPTSSQQMKQYDQEEDPDGEKYVNDSLAKRIVKHVWFDAAMSVVIVSNLAMMYLEADYRSSNSEFILGLQQDSNNWSDTKKVFEAAEYIFCSVFVVELVVRLYALGYRYLQYTTNLLDAIVVLVTSVETYFLTASGLLSSEGNSNVSLLRLFRLARVARVIKVIRFAQSFSELRVLVRTLKISLRALVMSMMLLSCMIMAGGVMLAQALTAFIENTHKPLADRQWVWEHFGSASRATRRLFAATFSTSWVDDYRMMVDKVGGATAIFWVLWTVLINFTVMRVIGAIFLKQTLVVAGEDAERMELQRMAKKESYAEEIRAIFVKADSSGDGLVSTEEFVEFIYSADVAEAFVKLDLELIEVVALFRLLADDTGRADYEEFLQGALKLKSNASTIDAIQILHASKMLEDQIEGLAELIVGGFDESRSVAGFFEDEEE
jgi:hypothetical protein